MKKIFNMAFFFAALMCFAPLHASTTNETGGDERATEKAECPNDNPDLDLPKVFLIGEYPEEFDLASAEYKLQLLEACQQDMNLAYIKWLSMLQHIEDYADSLDFEIRGVKMWIKVFWGKEGSVDHIAYYLKPSSRNVDRNELTQFLTHFTEQYQFPLIAEEKYSNYGSASFPVIPQQAGTNNN